MIGAGSRGTNSLPILVDLLNTVDLRRGRERLEDYRSAVAWLEAHGLPPSDAGSLRRFRDALRSMLDDADDDEAAAEVNEALGRCAISLRGHRAEVLAPPSGGATSILAAILARAALDGSWARVRLCADPRCRTAFLDRTRNGSATWCSPAGCGNRNRVARHRRRRASA